MVTLEKRTEKEYRALDLDSYSTLALFVKDRRKYYKKIYLGEEIEDKDDETKSILTGTLVETKLFEGEEEFNNKFYMSITEKDPTPNNLKFIHSLYRHTCISVGEDGVVTEDFLTLAQRAYKEVGIKKPGFEKFLEEFNNGEDKLYYKQLRESKPMNKSIISMQLIDNADKIIRELYENPVTGPIFSQKTDSRYTVFNQHQVDNYILNELLLKSMYDKIIVDHESATIQFYDLKCTYNVEEFYEAYYLYRYSYIQAYLYHYALIVGFVDLAFDYKDYKILRPKFIVVDSINNMKPLIYCLNDQDLIDAYHGFSHRNRSYPGVKSIIEDLMWAKENNEWRISRENAQNNGIIKLKK